MTFFILLPKLYGVSQSWGDILYRKKSFNPTTSVTCPFRTWLVTWGVYSPNTKMTTELRNTTCNTPSLSQESRGREQKNKLPTRNYEHLKNLGCTWPHVRNVGLKKLDPSTRTTKVLLFFQVSILDESQSPRFHKH